MSCITLVTCYSPLVSCAPRSSTVHECVVVILLTGTSRVNGADPGFPIRGEGCHPHRGGGLMSDKGTFRRKHQKVERNPKMSISFLMT